ncbi:MAG: DUF1492 domain-containing protein [Oscillibacter sp.]|nr:DUF1492 domain-containing protein [Oscillibacter sp.]
MTREQLNQHIALRRERRQAEEILASLRASASPGAQVITGMPHSRGTTDKTGDLAAEIVDVEEQIERLDREIAEREPEIEVYIRGIRSSRTRTIFRLRVLRGMSWKEVASVLGRWNTSSGVRTAFYAYVRTHTSH